MNHSECFLPLMEDEEELASAVDFLHYHSMCVLTVYTTQMYICVYVSDMTSSLLWKTTCNWDPTIAELNFSGRQGHVSRHMVLCHAAKKASTPHHGYIDRKKENNIFTRA